MGISHYARKSNERERVHHGASAGARKGVLPRHGNTVVSAASLFDIPSIFLTLHAAARDGFFSSWLCEPKSQYRLLLMLFWIVLLGRAYPSLGRKHRARLRVATRNGVLVGHTVLLSQDTGMEIFTCAVGAGFRRMGVGRRLVADAMGLAGTSPIHAACMPKSHGMCMLLRDAGFVETGRHAPGEWANVVLRHWQFTQPHGGHESARN